MNLIEQIEIILLIATMGLSILLSALSVSAYRNSRLKKMIYATIAYSLFAIVSLSQFYEEFYWKAAMRHILISLLILLSIQYHSLFSYCSLSE